MFCENCGTQIPDGAIFCPSCGFKCFNGAGYTETNSIQVKSSSKSNGYLIGTIVVVVISIIIILKGMFWLFAPDEIDLVKGGYLQKYDYGQSIGDALDVWFDGDVDWDSYEEYGITYVCAQGTCPYMKDSFNSYQVFIFEIIDDEHFRFIGAYDSDGYDIFTNSTEYMGNWTLNAYSSILGFDLHEEALKAAFGDAKSLNAFKESDSD